MPAGIELYNYVINQKGSPAIYSDTLAQRPPAGYPGRLFVSTDTQEIYRDTGVIWQLIGSGGPDTNIYNTDGTLLANRTMLMDGKTLTFEGLAQTNRIIMSADNNVARIFSFRTSGSQRWAFRVDGDETGSNAGADWGLRAYDDSGTLLITPIAAQRATGELTLRSSEVVGATTAAITGYENQATGTFIGGASLTGNTQQTAGVNRLNAVTDGNLTVADTVYFGGGQSKIRLSPSGPGTVTMSQGTTQRAASAHINQLQYDTSTASVTYTHAAVLQNRGIFRTSALNTLTITNVYSLLLNDLNEAGYAVGNLVLTNRWGIYQAGLNDINHLNANTLIGGTTNTGEKLQVFGNAILKSGYLDVDTSGQSRRISSKNATGGDGQNTFIGNGGENIVASPTNVNGSYNTSVGASALFNLTSGYSNTTIGQYGLFALTTGHSNTAVGVNALADTTTANQNTVVGLDAMRTNITGANNVAFGHNAGTYQNTSPPFTPITTNSNCVYLGWETRSLANGSTNEIVIGSTGLGLGSNSASYGNSSITKHVFNAGNVGIGTTSPSEVLHVVGRGRFTTIDNNASPTFFLTSDANGVVQKSTYAPVGGSGTTNYVAKFTASGTIGNSLIQDNGTDVGIGSNSAGARLEILRTATSGAVNNTTGSVFGSMHGPSGGPSAYGFAIRHNGTAFAGISGSNFVAQLISSTTNSNALEMYTTGSSPVVFGTNATERMRLSAAGNLLVGTTTDDGNRFQVAGTMINSTSAYFAISSGNVGIGTTTFGTAAVAVLAHGNGTAPSTSPANSYQLYSADITAGNAAPHFRTENGAIIKVYQETTGVGSAVLVGGGGTTITDTDTFDGYTLQKLVKALRNQGLLA